MYKPSTAIHAAMAIHRIDGLAGCWRSTCWGPNCVLPGQLRVRTVQTETKPVTHRRDTSARAHQGPGPMRPRASLPWPSTGPLGGQDGLVLRRVRRTQLRQRPLRQRGAAVGAVVQRDAGKPSQLLHGVEASPCMQAGSGFQWLLLVGACRPVTFPGLGSLDEVGGTSQRTKPLYSASRLLTLE